MVKSEFDGKNPRTQPAFCQWLTRISKEFFEHLMESMLRRTEACFESKVRPYPITNIPVIIKCSMSVFIKYLSDKPICFFLSKGQIE